MKCNPVHDPIFKVQGAMVLVLIVGGIAVLPCEGSCSDGSTGIDHGTNCLLLRHDGSTLAVSTLCPTFVLHGRPYGGGDTVGKVRGETESGRPDELTFAPMKLEGGGTLEVILHLQWSKDDNVLRKWARYRVTDAPQPVLLEQVVLDELDEAEGAVLIADQAIISPPASYPVLLKISLWALSSRWHPRGWMTRG